MLKASFKTNGALFKVPNIGKLIAKEALKDTSDWTLNKLRDLSPVRTGKLRSGWYQYNPTDRAIINNPVTYTPYVDAKLNMTGKTIPQVKQRLENNISKQIKNIK